MYVVFQGQETLSSLLRAKVEFSALQVRIYFSFPGLQMTVLRDVDDSFTDFGFPVFSAPVRKLNPSFIGAISCHGREFHTSGEMNKQNILEIVHYRYVKPVHVLVYRYSTYNLT